MVIEPQCFISNKRDPTYIWPLLQPERPITLSYHHRIILPSCHPIVLSLYHLVTPSAYVPIILQPRVARLTSVGSAGVGPMHFLRGRA